MRLAKAEAEIPSMIRKSGNRFSDRIMRKIISVSAISDGARGRIAQVVEQLTLNQRVVGSSPTAPTNKFNSLINGDKAK